MLSAISSFFFQTPLKDLEYQLDSELRIGAPLAIRIRFEVLSEVSSGVVNNAVTAAICDVMEWCRRNMDTDMYYQVTGVALENTALIFLLPFEEVDIGIVTMRRGAAFFGSAISAIAARSFIKFTGDSALGDVISRIFEMPPHQAVPYLCRTRSKSFPIFVKCIDNDYHCHHDTPGTDWYLVLQNHTFEDVEDEDWTYEPNSDSSESEEIPPLMDELGNFVFSCEEDNINVNDSELGVSPPPSSTVLE